MFKYPIIGRVFLDKIFKMQVKLFFGCVKEASFLTTVCFVEEQLKKFFPSLSSTIESRCWW